MDRPIARRLIYICVVLPWELDMSTNTDLFFSLDHSVTMPLFVFFQP